MEVLKHGMMPKGQAKLWRLIALDKAYNDDDEDAENIEDAIAQMIVALIDASPTSFSLVNLAMSCFLWPDLPSD